MSISFNFELLRPSIRQALTEDIGFGDITTLSSVPAEFNASATIFPKEPCTLAGVKVAALVFEELDPSLKVEILKEDGTSSNPFDVTLNVTGSARSILTAERTALNFIQRLSAIATSTRFYVNRIQGTGARIIDTRKTTPNLRLFEKFAVLCGGGENHRKGLYDQVLLKDNHLKVIRRLGGDGMHAAVRQAREMFPGKVVEIEVESVIQLNEAIAAGADIIMLDNMPPALMRECVKINAGRTKLEASGGINSDTVRIVAETGVDFISIGALTHSVKAIDFSLEMND
ncbi:MAG: carboxylating nicotinate-nucleotide diphosphorylase [Verrucomicrobiota bacterium]|nr:carboxylating nicotinate-nucleotide diphosphorylase [Verrucomicrobiota bacterium]